MQLDAVRHDVDGDGVPAANGAAAYRMAFSEAFPDAGARLRCGGACVGYELENDLRFDTDGNGEVDEDDDYWNDGAGWEPIGILDRGLAFAGQFLGNDYVIDGSSPAWRTPTASGGGRRPASQSHPA